MLGLVSGVGVNASGFKERSKPSGKVNSDVALDCTGSGSLEPESSSLWLPDEFVLSHGAIERAPVGTGTTAASSLLLSAMR